VRERAACLERSGVLQEFELEDERRAAQSEILAGDLDDRRAADVSIDDPVDGLDACAG
jgi:hypothetical protein